MEAQLEKSGKDGLKRRIQNCDIKSIRPEWIDEAKQILKDVDLAEVRKISDGAAVFYSWVRIKS